MLRRLLLGCGVAASTLYVATDVVAAIRFPTYHSFTGRAVSELMARGAPTERLVDPLFLAYGALMIAFAVGVWMSDRRTPVRLTGGLLFVYAASGLLGPTLFEMDVRSGAGPSMADILHIALTGVMVLLILATVAVGASIGGRGFRIFSFVILFTMILFGALTSFAMRGIGTGESTPWVGALERIDIGAFLLWVVVLAAQLLELEEGRGGRTPSRRAAIRAA